MGRVLRYIELKIFMGRECRVGNFENEELYYGKKNTCENILSY